MCWVLLVIKYSLTTWLVFLTMTTSCQYDEPLKADDKGAESNAAAWD